MRCPHCAFENRDGVRFCEECGRGLERVCPACGAAVPPGRKFCGGCGQPIHAERVLIFEAGHDDCVPATARDALWTATGRPTRITVPATHAGAFLGLTFLRRNHMRHRIVEFLIHALPADDSEPRATTGSAP
jgi:Double zinc ribbon